MASIHEIEATVFCMCNNYFAKIAIAAKTIAIEKSNDCHLCNNDNSMTKKPHLAAQLLMVNLTVNTNAL
ncbi:MAG: hypothetical protein ACK4HE_10440 [Chitinophagaceae bacterium]